MEETIKSITINTDASFHPEHKVGGYAFYITCDLFEIKKSGTFKYNPKTSMEAEMMCIGNALHTLLVLKEIPLPESVVINSDCLCAFGKMKVRSKDEIGKKVGELIEKVKVNYQIPKVHFVHVKAHSKKKDERTLANHWCDRAAKKKMKEEVKNLNNQNNEIQTV